MRFVGVDRRLGELIANLCFLAFRALLPTPPSQEIEGQKNLSLPISTHNELNRLSVYRSVVDS